MRIGILTFTDGTNYGQRLQNYALQELMEQYGNEVFTIKQEHHYSFRHKIKVLFMNVVNIKKTIRNKKRKESFAHFNKQYIKLYDQTLNENRSENIAEAFDLFVAGSDQIWNPYSPFVNSNMFMQFAPKQKRSTYAVSFSVDSIPEAEKEKYTKWISEIDYVSVRELQAIKIVEELTGKNPELCLDPTLLLDVSKWEYMADKAESTVLLPKKYMISLFLGNDYKEAEEHISRQTGISLLRFQDYEVAGPDEFLRIVKNASLVLTDSYHATIFSLLFKTPFVVFQRQSKGVNMNSRFETLDYYFDIKSRFYENVKKHERYLENIDDEKFNISLSILKKNSSDYLNTMLHHVGDKNMIF